MNELIDYIESKIGTCVKKSHKHYFSGNINASYRKADLYLGLSYDDGDPDCYVWLEEFQSEKCIKGVYIQIPFQPSTELDELLAPMMESAE